MDAPRINTDRRIRQHIGTALRHTRAACERSLKGEGMAAVQREAAAAIAALRKVIDQEPAA